MSNARWSNLMCPIKKYKLESSSVIVMASPLDGVMTKRKTSKRLSSKMRSSDLGSLLSLTIMKCFIIKTSRVWKKQSVGGACWSTATHTDAQDHGIAWVWMCQASIVVFLGHCPRSCWKDHPNASAVDWWGPLSSCPPKMHRRARPPGWPHNKLTVLVVYAMFAYPLVGIHTFYHPL